MRYFLALILIPLLFSCKPKEEMILIQTDYGDMKVRLYDSTPEHKKNMLKMAKEGFYDGTLFHRVIPGFMIQGGDPDSKGAAPNARLGMGGPGYTIPAEIGAKHFKGVLAAARTGAGNPEKRSSGSQFYIVQGKTWTDAEMARFRNPNVTYSQEDLNRYKTTGGYPSLDGEYTAYGEVIEGLEVIDKIAAVQIGNADRPVKDVTMKVSVVKG